ncbi:MAG: SGNH/GDSL hydrolase family protein [Prevotellaceae bacterium]|nr:SGNH/GDSL hydrolase family protein [Prevotellaceae bacterium]
MPPRDKNHERNKNVPLGAYKYAGWTKEELYQFRPAMAYLLSHITERYMQQIYEQIKAIVNE